MGDSDRGRAERASGREGARVSALSRANSRTSTRSLLNWALESLDLLSYSSLTRAAVFLEEVTPLDESKLRDALKRTARSLYGRSSPRLRSLDSLLDSLEREELAQRGWCPPRR
jgi:hypothetical protein